MGKKKRKRGATLPTRNKFWSNIVQSNNVELQSEFQAPHHHQDALDDLTDDTSPNIPMAQNVTRQNIELTPSRESQEKKQEPLTKSPIVLGLNPAAQNKKEEKTPQTLRNPAKGEFSTSQIEVLQGSASDIKLFSSKNMAFEKETSKIPSIGDATKHILEVTQPAKPQQYRHPTPQNVINMNLGHGSRKGPLITINPANKLNLAQGFRNVTPTVSLGPDPYNYGFYPKGIPKSFLMRPSDPAIPQPYKNLPQILPEQIAQTWPQMTPMFAPAETSQHIYDYKAPVTSANPMYVDTTGEPMNQQVYSPSDVYAENSTGNIGEEPREGSESPDMLEPGQKRLSAFQRLGPQPKKPKLTINLMCNKDQSIREVVDETEARYVPVHLREDIINSKDEIVAKYLKLWPWEKGLTLKNTVMPRSSKHMMILEQEQMNEIHEKSWLYVQVSVRGYPKEWTKEKLLDTIMDAVNGKTFIPLFIDFAPQECKFLVIRCWAALNALHKLGLVVKVGSVELKLTLSQTELTTSKYDFLPKHVLKKKLSMGYDDEKCLDLSRFTTKEDISHFIYYPLNRPNNQTDLIQLKSDIAWNYLVELNLSHNKITTIDSFNLPVTMPKLQRLDLSYNYIEKATLLLRCRELNLRSLKLEGNPLCHDYIDPAHYVRVLKMMFPALTEIDGEPIKPYGEFPKFKRNYCPEYAKGIIDKFLEVFFPLLDASDKDRAAIQDLYHEKATLTISYRHELRYKLKAKQSRAILSVQQSRQLTRWPPLHHDPYSFTVDLLHHHDSVTIFKVTGLVKLTAETLAEDEHLLAFSRTFVLQSTDDAEYKITNEMIYWDQPSKEYADKAFQITTVRQKRLSLKMESPPDEDLKEKLVDVFMQLTELSRSASERCLEHRDWNFKLALEFFIKLVKLDEIEILSKSLIEQ